MKTHFRWNYLFCMVFPDLANLSVDLWRGIQKFEQERLLITHRFCDQLKS